MQPGGNAQIPRAGPVARRQPNQGHLFLRQNRMQTEQHVARAKGVMLVPAGPIEGEANQILHGIPDVPPQIGVEQMLELPVLVAGDALQREHFRQPSIPGQDAPFAQPRQERLVNRGVIVAQEGRVRAAPVCKKLDERIHGIVVAWPD